jgi:hypothetical protein
MKVTISKTHLAMTNVGKMVEKTTKQAEYDVPETAETTVYIDGEAALIIEP